MGGERGGHGRRSPSGKTFEPQAELGRAVPGPPSPHPPRAPLTARPAVSACSGPPGHSRVLCCRPGGDAGQAQGAARAAVPTRALAGARAGPPRAAAAARAPPSCRGRMWAGSGREAGASWRGGSPGCTGTCPAPGLCPRRPGRSRLPLGATPRVRTQPRARRSGRQAPRSPARCSRAEDAGTRVAIARLAGPRGTAGGFHPKACGA